MTSSHREMDNELAAALAQGVDVQGRRIFLHGEVDESSVALAIRGLYLLADRGPDPIELFISSYGGDIDDAFALHDVTRTIRVAVHTVALGKCQSAAPLLVACGKKGERYASEHTEFMTHDATISHPYDTPIGMITVAEAVRERMDRMNRLLARYTKKDLRHWRRLTASKVDRYFDADTALSWGLIDQIWSEKA